MSHFSQITTKIRNLDSLKLALNDVGADWKAGPCDVRGYQGQTQSADVVISQDNGYDIGFRRNPETSDYELVADLQYWQQPLTVEGFLRQVSQRYAYNTVLSETSRQGFQVSEEQVREDGSVRLVVQRWNG
ncbi:DUF1257 domain-containing protein [Nodosilinea sp. LEGE 07298]|jgi:hypothetical protein|uniref:DUF1257 domain-containing protein n=1 Tax=Nodosilinea sp. LEGE 07298 TaxID=2777970 RepID=UPI00187EACBA|nr:DUF1257 domain-containing protein [Nodosilinea sp. LEGE 07298]MBE9111737.1 DUF1257 domain-containing protein [Nodosilinea sp. LEGE 07298]